MTAILGISAFYHDSAAALVVNGNIVAAAAEERFSRQKHDNRFPSRAIEYCLDEAGIMSDQLDFIGFHEKPLLKFDRLLETYLEHAPTGYRSFRTAMPDWLTTKLRLPRIVRRELAGAYCKRIVYCSHHESHAASAFFPSPFDEAAILTVDGVGEWSTATLGLGCGSRIEMKSEIRFPHSLGLLYSAFTSYCGFEVNDGEYKLMGLAAYGEPVYRDLITDRVVDLKPDGSFCLDMQFFNYCQGLTMTSSRMEQLLGFPPREPEDEITQVYKDLAASMQAVTEEILFRLVNYLHQTTGAENLVMAGGVALNCVANGKILRDGPFENVWIQPAAGDDGGALGTALLIWHQLLDNPRNADAHDRSDFQRGSLLGPSHDDHSIAAMLDEQHANFATAADDYELCKITSQLLAQGKVVAWFQGAMEFGPRALGSRSLLADPRDSKMHARLNRMVKNRESFRPFAPAALAEQANEHFDFKSGTRFPYMLFTVPALSAADFPAIANVDQSARLQTVDHDSNPLFYRLITSFHQLTDCPMLVNTSFNVRGEPIVCSPTDAYRCYQQTDIDALVIGKHVLEKQSDRAVLPSTPIRLPRDSPLQWLNLEVPWDPTQHMLRQFAFSFVLTLPIMAMMLRLRGQYVVFALAVAVLIGFVTVTFPKMGRFIYRTLLIGALPVVLLLSEFMLATIYYFVLTPIGLTLRLFNYSALTLRPDPMAATYWNQLVSQRKIGHYYRQW